MKREEVKGMDDILDYIDAAITLAKQEVYAEIADSLKSAGEQNLYDYSSIEEQAGKAGCALAGERIEWLVQL